jgi:hypothetical protein
VPDCFRVDDAAELLIANNRCHESKRHGIYVGGAAATRIVVSGNVLHGSGGNSAGIILVPGTATWGTARIEGNEIRSFSASASGYAPLDIMTSGGGSIGQVHITANVIDGAAPANYGLRSIGAGALRTGIITSNTINGQLEHYSSAVQTRDNWITGAVTIPKQ